MARKKYHNLTNFFKIKNLLKLSFYFLLFSFLFLSVVFIYYAKDLPRPEKFTEKQLIQSTKIYDRTGTVLLYNIYGEEKRTYVELDQISPYLQQAVMAAEDSDFYQHLGIDIKGMIRSFLADLRIGKLTYGGSTINQQLIRSSFLSLEKTVQRKIREIILSLELNRRYSKNQILEWYLNQIPFGSNAYGAEAASQTFFNKKASELSIAQAATLASLIKGPTYLSPYQNKEQLLIRKDYVLGRMKDLEYINSLDYENAKEEVLVFSKPTTIKAPYFTLQYIKNYLDEKYGQEFLETRGLKIYTTLDWDLQEKAETFIAEEIKINRSQNAYNAALVAIDPNNGEVLAMVGGVDYFGDPYPKNCISGKTCKFDPQFNVATLGLRQPGSTFKPFVYATAFKNGYTPDTKVIDEKTNFGIWGGKEYIPGNYDGLFHGEITLRDSLAQSINVSSIKVLLDFAGPEIENSVKTAQDMGITTLSPPYGPSIVLGGWEVKLLEMTSAYGVFATDGLKVPPTGILRIEDSNGNIIEENKKIPQRVLPIQVSREINDVLSDNNARAATFGFNSPLYFKNYQVAVKTGTTQNYQDAWAIGYTPSIVIGVWAGNNDNSPMLKRPGVVLAGVIFHNLMEQTFLEYPPTQFNLPKVNLP
ncbi:MAG: PBP1A family penicillin-binding protein [Patescibacteria group bacterium]|nr:PBP1A family penicillin-binding protein [Patescibacteria group bacterium]MBU1876807.1 PBP1A family penicillin-binding protein [Patescibacteria group bacterium]